MRHVENDHASGRRIDFLLCTVHPVSKIKITSNPIQSYLCFPKAQLQPLIPSVTPSIVSILILGFRIDFLSWRDNPRLSHRLSRRPSHRRTLS